MRKLCFLLLILFTTNVFAQQHILPEKEQIRRVLTAQQKSWNEGSIEDFMTGYWKNDSLSFIGKKGIMKGWQNTLDNYKKSYPDKSTMGTLHFEIISIELFSNTSAQVIGKWDLARAAGKGNVGGYFTLIFKKINKQWVIVSDHTS
jgi:ketosteroid isomerase-like protein